MKKFLYLLFTAPIIVLISSVIKSNIPEVWYMQNITLLALFFIASVMLIWDFNKSLSVFLGVCVLSTVFITQFNARAVLILIHIIFALLISYGISRIEIKQHNIILRGIGIAVIFQTTLLISQVFGFDPFFSSLLKVSGKEIVGFSGSKGQMGIFYALTTPLMAYYNPFLLVFSGIGLWFAKSSFALVSAICSVGLFFAFTNRKLLKNFFIICSILATIFFFKVDKLAFADFSMRFYVWKHAIHSVMSGNLELQGQNKVIIKTNPVYGYGFGNFLRLFPYVPEGKFNYRNEKFTHAHNDYIETFVFELGYIGIVVLLFIIGSFIVGFINTNKNRELMLYFSSITAYLLSAFGYFVSHIAVSGLLLIIFYGLYEGQRRESGKSPITGKRANA